MAEVNDGFDAYYAERLWQLLPAVYRTSDGDGVTPSGPLREVLDRIGGQVAVVRRSIDRLWADQAIETCDDWVVAYIGDLVGANLVNNSSPRGQRLDVAKTIHYRLRKGTLQVLEELARDTTGWTAHCTEGFRRLGRTRHGLDPVLGPAGLLGASPADVTALLGAEGLTGPQTGTPAGGLADLRAAHGAGLAGNPFDEVSHTADVRLGQGAVGHYAIPKLLVFLWRLISFPVRGATPVAVAGHPGEYVFDPTGRSVPLFLAPAPAVDDFADDWTAAKEWQVPGPLTRSLLAALTGSASTVPPGPPYPDAGVPLPFALHGGVGGDATQAWPEQGRFATPAAPDELTVDYHYGFASTIGAGPYDRDLLGDPPTATGAQTRVTGGSGLATALTAAAGNGTVTIEDSLTYTTLGEAGPVGSLLIRAGAQQRPVLRPPPDGDPWIFTGAPGAALVLDGLTVSGCDVVLRGPFDSVRLTACTIDPGTAARGSLPLAGAADGRPLRPSRIFIEADAAATAVKAGIGRLEADHCVLGPIRTRLGGTVDTVAIADSIVQGLPESRQTTVYDPLLLAQGLAAGIVAAGAANPAFPLSAAVLAAIPGLAAALQDYLAAPLATQQVGLPLDVLNALDTLIAGAPIYNPALLRSVSLSPETRALAAADALDAAQRARLNRGLLKDAFPVALGVAAIAVAGAAVQLTRVSVMGRLAAQRLDSSDSILAGFAMVQNLQDSCVRFTATAAESLQTPGTAGGAAGVAAYESVSIPHGARIFASEAFGAPAYGQLLESADVGLAAGSTGGSILTGGSNGSEMGAFCADLGPVKEQGLLVKYAEYMPLGLAPVIVHVT